MEFREQSSVDTAYGDSMDIDPAIWPKHVFSTVYSVDEVECRHQCMFHESCHFSTLDGNQCHLGNMDSTPNLLTTHTNTDLTMIYSKKKKLTEESMPIPVPFLQRDST